MMFLGNISGVLCTLLALAALGSSYPATVDVTAEDFMNMKEIRVRSDGTPINQTDTSDIVCELVITQKGGTLVACDTAGVSTGTGYATTLGWSLSIGVNSEFSSAGFSVTDSETYSVTNSFVCNGVAAEGGDICVLFYQAVTAFTVNVNEIIECPCWGGGTASVGTAVVYAPNANQIGSIARRGINVPQHGVVQCVGDADRRINYYCGPPGGPEWWNGMGAGPWIPAYVNERQPAGCAIPIEANMYTA